MSRRTWGSLSSTYRRRLQRSGITRASYESGISLTGARGHAKTPEHPGQGKKDPRFQKYYTRRNAQTKNKTTELRNRFIEHIKNLFADSEKFNKVQGFDHKPSSRYRYPTNEELEKALTMNSSQIASLLRNKGDVWWPGFYH